MAASVVTSSIVNKPARGWLHPDHLLAKDGINYGVKVSLKNLLFSIFSLLFFPLFFFLFIIGFKLTTISSLLSLKDPFFSVCWLFGGQHIHESVGL